METIDSQSQELVMEIKRRAFEYVWDNFNAEERTPRLLLIIENAMLIGSSIALEVSAKHEKS